MVCSTLWSSQTAPTWAVLATCALLNRADAQLDAWLTVNDVGDYEDDAPALRTCLTLLKALLVRTEVAYITYTELRLVRILFILLQEQRDEARALMQTYESNTSDAKLQVNYDTETVLHIWQSDLDVIKDSIQQTQDLIDAIEDNDKT